MPPWFMKCWVGAWEPFQAHWEIELFNPFLQMRKTRPRKPLGPDFQCVTWIRNRIKSPLTVHRMSVLCHRLTKGQVWTVVQSNLFFNSYPVFDRSETKAQANGDEDAALVMKEGWGSDKTAPALDTWTFSPAPAPPSKCCPPWCINREHGAWETRELVRSHRVS